MQTTLPSSPTIASPLANFEGISNQDNFNLFGFRVNPPDPVGDVGPNNYVEMANLAFAVYNKAGTLLLGPADTGTLWTDFNADCTEPSGDPIVVYDQVADRWILSQFTTAGPEYFECIAVSTTGDPTGTYSGTRSRRASTSPTIRSWAFGRTRTSSRRANSGRSAMASHTASACTPSSGTRC